MYIYTSVAPRLTTCSSFTAKGSAVGVLSTSEAVTYGALSFSGAFCTASSNTTIIGPMLLYTRKP